MKLDRSRLETLIPRYGTAGPRYTSYPTAPTWTEAFGADEQRRALAGIDSARDEIALYAHVPFCESLCHFCACNRVITRKPEPVVSYLDVLEREVAAVREAVPGEATAGELHLGGGTPTHLEPRQLERLVGAMTRAFPLRDDAVVSIEVDPRVTTAAHVATLTELGFNRISLGVQDFDETVQQAVHRNQSAEQVEALTELARRSGFGGINFDLIYGLPFQSEASFGATLETVLRLRPDRIALYSYAHVTWVAKQQRGFDRFDLPSAELKLRIMLLAIETLIGAGYRYIGLDHFALPEDELAVAAASGTLHRNFMGYTTRAADALLAFGPSAISETRDGFGQSVREIGDWQERVLGDGIATFRGHRFSDEDRRRGWVIHSLMCRGEVSAAGYGDAFGRDLAQDFSDELADLAPSVDDGLVEISSTGLRVTDTGRLLVRNLAMAFDAYLPAQLRSASRLFSQTV